MIRYLQQQEIDRKRWDACIITSALPLVYGESWYLDIVSPGWEGLVADDYRAVFPLPVKSRFGIRYLSQPPFTQQLGSFGNVQADEFIAAIPDGIRLIDLQLNEADRFTSAPFKTRPNMVLGLGRPLDTIRASYSENLRRNLRKAEKSGLVHGSDVTIQELIGLFRAHRGKEIDGLSQDDYVILSRLTEVAASRDLLEIGAVRSNVGKLLAGAVFLRSRHGWIFLFSATHPEGRETGAMSALIDRFIASHFSEKTLVDFEGSVEPNLKRFYGSFGSSESVYLQIRINRLPFPLRLLKRPL